MEESSKKSPKKARIAPYSEAVAGVIVGSLDAGVKLRDACEAVGISEATFDCWVKSEAGFAERVAEHLAKAKVDYIGTIASAARKHDGRIVTRSVRDEVRMKKTRFPDGQIVDEPVALTIVEETTRTEEGVSDWRAAEVALKRFWPAEYGDRQDVTSNGNTLEPTVIKVVRGVRIDDL